MRCKQGLLDLPVLACSLDRKRCVECAATRVLANRYSTFGIVEKTHTETGKFASIQKQDYDRPGKTDGKPRSSSATNGHRGPLEVDLSRLSPFQPTPKNTDGVDLAAQDLEDLRRNRPEDEEDPVHDEEDICGLRSVDELSAGSVLL